MATLKMLDPRASVNTKDRPLVPGLDTLEGKVIGIIDNGQANSTTMFQEWQSWSRKNIGPQKFYSRPNRRTCRVRRNQLWRNSLAGVMLRSPDWVPEGRAHRGVSTMPSNFKSAESRR